MIGAAFSQQFAELTSGRVGLGDVRFAAEGAEIEEGCGFEEVNGTGGRWSKHGAGH